MKMLQRSNTHKNSGFTLVELLIVVALIALIGTMAVPGISNTFKISLQTATREIASTIKETYNASMMTKRVYRIVYDLKEQAYWVEFGPASLALDTEESLKHEERMNRFKKEKKEEGPSFQMATNITRSKKSLPRGVTFKDIKTEQAKELATEGTVYTHFFPHGMIEQTVVHLQDNSQHQSTLWVQPLVGRTRVIDRYVPYEEVLKEQ